MEGAAGPGPLKFEEEGIKAVVTVASMRARVSRGGPDGAELPLCCFECMAVLPKLLICSRCRIARYCSKECQKAAWKAEYTGVGHKNTCSNFSENLRPAGMPADQGKCAAISAAGSSWISFGCGDYDSELQACLAAREKAFFVDTGVPDVLHLTISCTVALDTVRLGISATFHHGRPMYAMDLVYASVDSGSQAEALLETQPSGDLTPAARTRAMDEVVRFAERATAGGRGSDIKAILLGRGLIWLAEEGAAHDALLARLRAAGLSKLLGMHAGANHTMEAMVGAMIPPAERGGGAQFPAFF